MAKARRLDLGWILLLISLVSPALAENVDLATRNEAFINYKEGPGPSQCTDRLPDCHDRAIGNGCSYNAFVMRTFCPVACDHERCSHRGTRRARHKGHASTSGTVTYQQAMTQQLGIPKTHWKSVQLLVSDERLYLSDMGMGTYLGEADSATDEAVVDALLYSVTHGWNVIDTASNYRWGRGEQAVGTALDLLLSGNEAASFSTGTVAQAEMTSTSRANSPVAGFMQLATRSGVASVAGAVAEAAVLKGEDVTRDMLFISTKAGFTTPKLVSKLIQEGKLHKEDVVQNMYSLHPAYLEASLDLSLERMNLQAVDLLYLHNSAEVLLPALGREEYMERLEEAFRVCEKARMLGKIVYYGLATWDCFRVPPDHPSYLSLDEVVRLATKVGGARHGFRFVQLPINPMMPEAWIKKWQTMQLDPSSTAGTRRSSSSSSTGAGGRSITDGITHGGTSSEEGAGSSTSATQAAEGTKPRFANMTLIEVAAELQIGVFSSGPLGEGGLVSKLSFPLQTVPELLEQSSAASKLLQHARSTPGLISTLVGHKTRANVESNLMLNYAPRLTAEQHVSAQRSLAAAVKAGNRKLDVRRKLRK